jgi:hypothetical protein
VKPIIILLLFIVTLQASAEVSAMNNIVQLMRETPAYINGDFQLSSAVNLMRDTSGLIPKTVELKAQRTISFYADEHSLNLNTQDALYVWYGGFKSKIKNISYDDRTKEFSIQSSTPLGLFNSKLNTIAKSALDSLFKNKLKLAFQELRRIRSEKSPDQAKQSILAIISTLFSGGSGKPAMPSITGEVNLAFKVDHNRTIPLTDQIVAKVKKEDSITLGSQFTLVHSKTTFHTLELKSNQGIILQGDTRWPEIKSVEVHQLEVGPSGLILNYEVGAEQVIKGLIFVLNAVSSNNARRGNSADCIPEIELASIRKKLDLTFQGQLSYLLHHYRAPLIAAGVSPTLINALD